MANGRQRKRDVLLAKKAAEQNAKLGLAGLSTEGLTSIVSDDSNDLDNVSFSTTDGANVNGMVRIMRVGRMYKLVKLTRLLRVLKVVKRKGSFIKYLQE